jgi:hypothetical protein
VLPAIVGTSLIGAAVEIRSDDGATLGVDVVLVVVTTVLLVVTIVLLVEALD